MNTHSTNPYIGPRTFQREEGHLFFGRDREAAGLEALLASEKLVLFYAQSGAGKSSLINARLIPRLEKKRFEVLPVARLGGDSLVGAEAGNIYIVNLFRSLHRRASDSGLFQGVSLSYFLKKLNEDPDGYFYDPGMPQSLRDRKPWPRMLIIDQFEELFSTNMEAWQQREEFFRQLAQAMQVDPLLWVLLVMREDYIAALDPYSYLLPKGLRVRYYMERLSHEAAVKAIRSPVEGLRPYPPGVAERLADDLSRVKVQKPDGTPGTEPGQYIEPVQLQVVCYSLWENLKPGAEITDQDLLDVGDVNQSLARYYDQRVSEVARAKHVGERQIRDWFEHKLITAGGIRSMVIQERKTPPGGLDDEVIQLLQSDLVRAEKRGGATWYELTHDRLVEPIHESNKIWFEKNLRPFQRQALVWEDQRRNDSWLLRNQAYEEVQPWVKEHHAELTDLEWDFLEASRKKRDQQLEERRRNQRYTNRLRIIATIAILMLIVTIVFAGIVVRQAKIARIGELAAQSVSQRDQNFLSSLLLGVEAYKETSKWIPSGQAQSTLLVNTLADPKLDQYLSGNTGPVVSVAFSPDGSTLASGTYGRDILLWDVNTRQIIGKLKGHSNIIRSIAFSPDGKWMASGSQDKTIILWDAKTGQPVHTLNGHLGAVTSISFSRDGRTLASGSIDKTVMLWDVETGQLKHKLSGHTSIVRKVAFSPVGMTLASGSDDGTILLWNGATGESLGKLLVKHTDPVLKIDLSSAVDSIAFSRDGKTLASGDRDKDVILWDVQTGKRIHTLSRHSDAVWAVAFSPDGNTLASGSADRTIILWDTNTGQFLDQLKGHTELINSLSFSPDGSTLASGSGDSTIILWNMSPRQPLAHPVSGFSHSGPVSGIAFSPDGKTVASGSPAQTIMLWDARTGQAFSDEPLYTHIAGVSSIAFSPDGRMLALGSDDQTIILWDVKTRQPIGKPLPGHTKNVTSVAFSPDGRTLASGSEDQTIILWDVKTRQPIAKPLTGHTKSVTSLAFNRDGRILASGSDDATVILWDVKKGQAIKTLRGHVDRVKSLAFSPDGSTLASGSYDGSLILWDLEKGQANVTWNGPFKPINSLAFSPDGKTLALGSDDQTVKLWDVNTHQPIVSLGGYQAPVQSVAFSSGGKILASASADQNVVLWDLNEQSWVNESCQRAGRNFTRKEWVLFFPKEEYRKICPQYPLEPTATPTGTP
jgi:WD40 repeat protein